MNISKAAGWEPVPSYSPWAGEAPSSSTTARLATHAHLPPLITFHTTARHALIFPCWAKSACDTDRSPRPEVVPHTSWPSLCCQKVPSNCRPLDSLTPRGVLTLLLTCNQWRTKHISSLVQRNEWQNSCFSLHKSTKYSCLALSLPSIHLSLDNKQMIVVYLTVAKTKTEINFAKHLYIHISSECSACKYNIIRMHIQVPVDLFVD